MGFSIIFTIHFGVPTPIFGNTPYLGGNIRPWLVELPLIFPSWTGLLRLDAKVEQLRSTKAPGLGNFHLKKNRKVSRNMLFVFALIFLCFAHSFFCDCLNDFVSTFGCLVFLFWSRGRQSEGEFP